MEIKNTYKSRIKEYRLEQDVFLASIDNYTNQTDTISKSIHQKYVQFYFCTKGSATFHFSETYSKLLGESLSFMIYNPANNAPLQISLSSKSKLTIIVIGIHKLHDFFGAQSILSNIFKDNISHLYEEKPIGNDLKLLFPQIENYTLKTEFKNLYLKSKVNEVLILYFSGRMSGDENCPYMSNEEIAKTIKTIKELIINNPNKSINIEEISTSSGLTTYKLKEGFKKIYGQTINQFALSTKLENGKELLELKKLKVKDVALKLGYENPSHFIDAFKKKYGITPKQYLKKLL